LLIRQTIAICVCSFALLLASATDAAEPPTGGDLTALANSYFSSTTNVHYAGTPTALWAAVLGVRRGGRAYAARVFARGVGEGWSALPAPPGRVGAGVRFQVADNVGSPCLKFLDERGRPRLPCWTGRGWRELRLVGAFARGMTPVDMTSVRRRPTVLLYDRKKLRVVRWAGRRWVRMGSDLRHSTRRPSFGEANDRTPTIGFDMSRGRARVRAAYELRRGHWNHLADVVLHGSGPSQSGPVIDGRVALSAVVNARGNDWPLYAVVADRHAQQIITGHALNEGPGAAQGSVFLADRGAWAIWQQNAQRRDGLFDTRIILRPIDIAGGSAGLSRLLWSGVSNGPGDLQVLDALGGSWVAYMPAQQRSARREVAIEPLTAASQPGLRRAGPRDRPVR
jgi:hypothetical protein